MAPLCAFVRPGAEDGPARGTDCSMFGHEDAVTLRSALELSASKQYLFPTGEKRINGKYTPFADK